MDADGRRYFNRRDAEFFFLIGRDISPRCPLPVASARQPHLFVALVIFCKEFNCSAPRISASLRLCAFALNQFARFATFGGHEFLSACIGGIRGSDFHRLPLLVQDSVEAWPPHFDGTTVEAPVYLPRVCSSLL